MALPASDAPPKGLRRRDPFEVLAREIVSSGAVVPELLEPTRDYLRRMAQADPNALGVATYIAAPSRTDNTFANLLVVGPVLVPRLAHGDVDWDEVTRRAVSPADGETPRVERVQLPWGAAVKVRWTRDRGAESPVTTKHIVGFWVLAEHLESLIVIQGDVSAGSTDDVRRLLSDIDEVAASMKVLAG